jgi:hypothetical protein
MASAERHEWRPREPEASFARIAPDGRRLAYVLPRADAPGAGSGRRSSNVFVAEADSVGVCWAEVEEGWEVEELLWSPTSSHVAFVICRDELTETHRAIAWASSKPPGPRRGGR